MKSFLTPNKNKWEKRYKGKDCKTKRNINDSHRNKIGRHSQVPKLAERISFPEKKKN